MEGSIQKRGKTYYAVISLSRFKRKWFKGGKTKKEAQTVLADKLSELGKGTYKEIPTITFNQFTELWLTSHAEVNCKASTSTKYKNCITNHLIPYLDHMKLADIAPGRLHLYAAERAKEASPKTLLNEITLLKQLFRHAYHWGYTRTNLAEFVKRPKQEKVEIEILEPDQVQLFLKHSDSHYRVAFLTGFMTGMRAGEIWGLQWGDIDWNTKQIYVRRSLWKGTFQTPKTSYSVRKIDIPESLVYELKKWKLACPVSDDDLVFPSPEGKMTIHENVIRRYFNATLRKAGLHHVSFHSVRHTNASMRIHAGQNIKYVSSQLGHASIKITLDTYSHLFHDAEFVKQQVELLEGSFRQPNQRLEPG